MANGIGRRGGHSSNGTGSPTAHAQSTFGDYWGKPRLRVQDGGKSGEAIVVVPADPAKVKAYKEQMKKVKRGRNETIEQ